MKLYSNAKFKPHGLLKNLSRNLEPGIWDFPGAKKHLFAAK
jgi:hypothetical protein